MASPQNLLLQHKPSAPTPFLFLSLARYLCRISVTRPKTRTTWYIFFCKKIESCVMVSATKLKRKLLYTSFITQLIHSFYSSFIYSLVCHQHIHHCHHCCSLLKFTSKFRENNITKCMFPPLFHADFYMLRPVYKMINSLVISRHCFDCMLIAWIHEMVMNDEHLM